MMKISELIRELEKVKERDGDLPVVGCEYPGEADGSSLTRDEMFVRGEEGEKIFYIFHW